MILNAELENRTDRAPATPQHADVGIEPADERAPCSPPQPDMSIAIATFNRARVLRMTLASLAGMDTQGIVWELVVVDNGSADDTREAVASFADRLPVRYVFEPKPGKSNALNRVASSLKGRLISFTDDDVLFARDWMRTVLACADDYPEFGCFGGRIVPHWTRSPYARHLRHPFARAAYSLHDPGSGTREYPAETWPAGANTVYRREVLDPRPFDPGMGPVGSGRLIGNDTVLAKHIANKGVKLLHVPEAVVRHIIRPQDMLPSFLRRRAYQRARTLAMIDRIEPAPRLAGVPVWMLGQLGRRAIRLTASVMGMSDSTRVDAEIQFADAWGWVVGARLAHRKGNKTG